MENFINSLPKPVLVFGAISLGIFIFMIYSPPHTVCDTQASSLRESQVGNIFPSTVKKNKIPPVLAKHKESCQLGNSAGSCYEYFMVLKKVADDVSKASSECTTELFDINEVKAALNDGIEMMVRLAWGVKPPEPGMERFGWLQDADIAIFCRLKGVYIRAKGEPAWVEFRKKVYEKLPGEEVAVSSDPTQVMVEARKATALMQEQDIWSRSLFSVRCEGY